MQVVLKWILSFYVLANETHLYLLPLGHCFSSVASATPGYDTIESFDGSAFASAEGRLLMLALGIFCPPSSRTGKISSAFSYDILPVGCVGWSSSSTTEWSPQILLSYEPDAFGLSLWNLLLWSTLSWCSLVAAVIGIRWRARASLALSLAVWCWSH